MLLDQRLESSSSARIREATGSPFLLLLSVLCSQSPSNAQACTIFPPVCRIGLRGRKSPRGLTPVSSSNSRLAAPSGSSSGVYSPLGIDQAPSSLPRQYGPPGCTSNTSSRPAVRRYMRRPALFRAMAISLSRLCSPADRQLLCIERSHHLDGVRFLRQLIHAVALDPRKP